LPLAVLFGQRLRGAITRLGVHVITEQTVRGILQLDEGGAAVETHDGTRYQTDHVIVAVPWHAVGGVLSCVNLPGLDQYIQFPSSPITGLHLWFDREISDRPHFVMVGTMAQWLFRNPFSDQRVHDGCYYQVVISASRTARSLAKEELIAIVLGELRQMFPGAKEARLLRSRIVTDPRSVFSIRPEVDAARPESRTALPWLHLAGDWIATGWPATMEGAVISGRMAAQSVLSREGFPAIEVDVPQCPGWLARHLIRF
jgi:predicted NAD/FAD-dependent oxidoreductase